MAAMADHLFCFFIDRNSEAVIKDKELSPPFIMPFFKSVIDDPALQLIDMFKSFFFQQCGIELAADPSRAIHHHFRLLWVALFF